MGFKTEHYASLKEAKAEAKSFDYVLLYYPHGIRLIAAGTIDSSDWEGCTEARAFKKEAEIHFLLDGEQKAIRVSDTDCEDMLIKEYKLSGKFRTSGKEYIRVIEYLETDEDGQCSIRLTRLSELL